MAVRPVIMCGLETGTLIKIQGQEEENIMIFTGSDQNGQGWR